MPSSTILNSLKINKLTEAQFDAAVQQGVIGANDLSILIDADNQNIQVNTLPTASIDELDNIYQYVGTTDANYTNGYFYKCVSDGQSTPTYSWTQVNVQPGGGGGSYTAGSGIDITSGVISVTSPTVVESGVSSGVTDSHSIFGGTVTDNYSIAIGSGASASDEYNTVIGKNASSSGELSVAIGTAASTSSHYTTAVGAGSSATYKSTAIGRSCNASGTYSTALGWNCTASGDYSVQLGGAQYGVTNSTANTIKYANTNGNFEIVSADGTIPSDRLKNSISKYTTLPTAASTNVGWIVQYIGATDSSYTHGYIYECVSDGASTPTYSWAQVNVQPSGGGGSLPSQTGNAGKFLTTDGTDASWSDAAGSGFNVKDLTNDANLKFFIGKNGNYAYSTIELYNSSSVSTGWTFETKISYNSFSLKGGINAWLVFSSAVSGSDATATGLTTGTKVFYPNCGTTYANDIMLGAPNKKWNTLYTTKINNGGDITVPTTSGTMALTSDIPTIATSVSSSSTNSETVGAKLFYDTVGNIEAALQAINSGS